MPHLGKKSRVERDGPSEIPCTIWMFYSDMQLCSSDFVEQFSTTHVVNKLSGQVQQVNQILDRQEQLLLEQVLKKE